jgi:hypothetical protein
MTNLGLSEARSRAIRFLNDAVDQEAGAVDILDAATIERRYGWVFFYNSVRYLETGDPAFALAGNGPIVVLRKDGAVIPLGSAQPVDDALRDLEDRL